MRYSPLILVGLLLLLGSNTSRGSELSDVWSLGRAAVAAEEKKDYNIARRDYDAAVQLHPKNSTAYAHRGLFFLKHDQYALAAKDFDTALSLQRTVVEYAYWRALAYRLAGRYDLALADINQLLSLHSMSRSGGLLNTRAWILATCPDARYRNGQQAVKDATAAANIGSLVGKAGYLDTLAAAYAETGDFESAIKNEEKAIGAATKLDKVNGGEERLALYKQHRPYRDYPAKEKKAQAKTGG